VGLFDFSWLIEIGEFMQTIGVYEAKTHLPKLLARVVNGEQITITKHGVPIAVLQAPSSSSQKTSPKKTIEDLRMFRKKCKLNGLSIRDLIDEGRR